VERREGGENGKDNGKKVWSLGYGRVINWNHPRREECVGDRRESRGDGSLELRFGQELSQQESHLFVLLNSR
jgi:hypothetical protein